MSQPKRDPTPPAAVSFLGGFWGVGMHFYQFHIGDYKSHTHHLTPLEDLAYRRLLDHYYLHEIPIRQRDIARQIGLRDFEQEVLTVLNEFFVSTDKGFVNPRADTEIKNFREHQAVSAFGAFTRDNPLLKPFVEKSVFIQRFIEQNHQEYIAELKAHHLPMMGTSSPHDATNNHKPITNNHINTSICPPDGEPEPPVKKLPECDHKAVIELYHQHLPTMRRVEVWNETRAGYLRQRWREVAAELAQEKNITASDVLNWWAEFFQSVGKSRFLTGRVNGKDGRAFVADLEWILKPSNFAKIVEGKYHGNH
jgi:uncharacterized protein YdaU (DUF1376 family)